MKNLKQEEKARKEFIELLKLMGINKGAIIHGHCSLSNYTVNGEPYYFEKKDGQCSYNCFMVPCEGYANGVTITADWYFKNPKRKLEDEYTLSIDIIKPSELTK